VSLIKRLVEVLLPLNIHSIFSSFSCLLGAPSLLTRTIRKLPLPPWKRALRRKSHRPLIPHGRPTPPIGRRTFPPLLHLSESWERVNRRVQGWVLFPEVTLRVTAETDLFLALIAYLFPPLRWAPKLPSSLPAGTPRLLPHMAPGGLLTTRFVYPSKGSQAASPLRNAALFSACTYDSDFHFFILRFSFPLAVFATVKESYFAVSMRVLTHSLPHDWFFPSIDLSSVFLMDLISI